KSACTYGPRPLPSLAACAAEEKRREEKRREEKRRFFAGWIHFRLLIRFDRLKKKIFTDVEGRIISGSGRCFNKK
ncbi:hypothetical protein AB6B17_07385, partial [Neisseria gonorrhoeae]